MDNQLTTTFIPKKPLGDAAPQMGSAPVSRPVGLLSTISVILFFVTIAIAVGVYFLKAYETSQVATLSASITAVEKTFEPQLITKLQSLDKQLKNANGLLASHTVISPIFDMLEASTLKQVRFNKFDVAFDDVKGVQIKMSGEGDSYQSIAQQSDVLGSNTFLKDVLFSNFFLTQKGKVSFDLSYGVRPDFTDFEKAPLSGSGNAATATTPVAAQ
ncbi:MAG: hypothetical protein JWM20_785 [Patescibacteria group bacterium]|nr:hypothetical protein [Patescibacteria group bacterium]